MKRKEEDLNKRRCGDAAMRRCNVSQSVTFWTSLPLCFSGAKKHGASQRRKKAEIFDVGREGRSTHGTLVLRVSPRNCDPQKGCREEYHYVPAYRTFIISDFPWQRSDCITFALSFGKSVMTVASPNPLGRFVFSPHAHLYSE